MTSLPAKFEICTKYNRTSRYVLTLNAEGYYEMAPAQRTLDDAYDVLKKYSQGFVKEAVYDGVWEITKNLDEVAVEPELVFPFTVLHTDFSHLTADAHKVYTFTKGDEGYANMYSWQGNKYDNCYTEDECKKFIKDGIWIVKHVGEKALEPPVEAPQSAPLNNLTLTVTADTEDAVAAVDRLTEALENLAISYESVIALQREFKEGV